MSLPRPMSARLSSRCARSASTREADRSWTASEPLRWAAESAFCSPDKPKPTQIPSPATSTVAISSGMFRMRWLKRREADLREHEQNEQDRGDDERGDQAGVARAVAVVGVHALGLDHVQALRGGQELDRASARTPGAGTPRRPGTPGGCSPAPPRPGRCRPAAACQRRRRGARLGRVAGLARQRRPAGRWRRPGRADTARAARRTRSRR